jgi:uncharacterized protein YlxW (UPF0749 family)
MSIVAAILGFLVVLQIHVQQAAPGLAGLSAQDLTVLVANLNARNDQLRTEVASLEQQLASITNSQAQGQTFVDQVRGDRDRIAGWAGLLPVDGPGVSITIEGRIAGPGVEDLINELHNAGAEAIAVDDVRVVPGSVVSGPAGGLAIDDEGLADPFEVKVVGSKEALTGSLTRAGGVIAQLAATYPAARLTVTPVDDLEIPATKRDLIPRNGHPRL